MIAVGNRDCRFFTSAFVKIMRSNDFSKWYYIDPFSGSGILKLKKKYLFPGSPLVTLFKNETLFHNYYLSDKESQHITALKQYIDRISLKNHANIYIKTMAFSDLAKELFTGERPTHWKDKGYLVFLDPYGLSVDWDSMQRILRSGAVDVIFTFMTWAMRWNQNIKQSEYAITRCFGNENWKDLTESQGFVNSYCEQIEELGYLNKYKTFTIDVIQEGGRRYDLILATQSSGASNVLKDLKQVVKSVSTDLINSAFSVTVGEQSDLDSFGN